MSTYEQAPDPNHRPAPHTWRDPYVRALHDGAGTLSLRRLDGSSLTTQAHRWWGPADAADITVLHRCRGAVLDIGCGPGRLVAALAGLGHTALGIDVSHAAVASTERTGGRALCRSVFDAVPAEGNWQSALLMDGNIGIGGAPDVLLERVGNLLDPTGGMLFVEGAAGDIHESVQAQFADGQGQLGAPFPWARVGVWTLRRMALETGWEPISQWSSDDRHFLQLYRQDSPPPTNQSPG